MLTDDLRDKGIIRNIIKQAGGKIPDEPEQDSVERENEGGIPVELIESSKGVVRRTIPIQLQRKNGR